jgi:hypothetical protein
MREGAGSSVSNIEYADSFMTRTGNEHANANVLIF